MDAGVTGMAVDMKRMIAEATRTLLMDKNVKKLTVKDIVEECHITRQTFYYHFEDIPNLIRWILEQGMEQMLQEIRRQGNPEEGLRYLFLMAVNSMPYIKKSLQSNYAAEIQRLLKQQMYRFFEQIVEEQNRYQGCSQFEQKLILRYHSEAFLGLLRDWTEEDSKNLDRIVHNVYLLMTSSTLPFFKQETDRP